MLAYYAERLATVEINYTFYRMPGESLLARWVPQVPPDFRFTLKASRRITHDNRLRNCGPLVASFCQAAGALGGKLGAILFQLPPSLKKDIALFEAFLAEVPQNLCAAFEFRHPSWLSDDVYERLSSRNFALCVADGDRLSTPLEMTADYAYFRLRDEGYTPRDIAGWAERISEATASSRDVFVYFKHEEAGKGPELARLLMSALGIPAQGARNP
jgi:uncharacterized protein YecE (DUF72 family)